PGGPGGPGGQAPACGSPADLRLRLRGRGGRLGFRGPERQGTRNEDPEGGTGPAPLRWPEGGTGMSERPTPEALRPVPLLASLSQGELRAFAGRAELKRVEAQCPLFREGEPADPLLLVLSGSAEVVKKDPAGKHQVLAVLSAPAVLGEMTVL